MDKLLVKSVEFLLLEGNISNMKVCSTCKIKKRPSDFYRNKNTKDGLQSNCKECANISALKSHRKNKDKWQLHYRETRREYRSEYKTREVPMYKRKTRAQVYKAVRSGKLVRKPCHCGNVQVEGHHNDYSKPLKVVWLCRSHHLERHNQ